MMRIWLRPRILLPLLGSLVFLAIAIIASSVAWLHPEQFNAKTEIGAWKIRSLEEVMRDAWLARVGLLAFLGVGLYFLYDTLADYIFYVRGERLFHRIDEFDPTQSLTIGPLTGLFSKGLTLGLHYKAPWEGKLGSSFRLTPGTPMMTYHTRLFGYRGNEKVLLEERTFQHVDEVGDDSPTWKEETFTVTEEFPVYFLELSTGIDTEKLVWPRKKRNDAGKPAKAYVVFMLRLNVTLRWKDLKSYQAAPHCSVREAKVMVSNGNEVNSEQPLTTLIP